MDRERVMWILYSLAMKYRGMSSLGGPLKDVYEEMADVYEELAEAHEIAMKEFERE